MIKRVENRGSILIWTLLLGISLASVFFFFSQRLGQNTAVQRETIKYQNSMTLIESYADYLENLSAKNLIKIRGDIDFEGITGTITNVEEEIVGKLDSGKTADFTADITVSDEVKIEWNLCVNDEENRLLNIFPLSSAARIHGNCGIPTPLEYDAFTQITNSSFSLEAGDLPLSYRLSLIDTYPTGDSTLYSNEWQMDLEISINSRKKISISKSFIPKS